jgi:hypothetical protein
MRSQYPEEMTVVLQHQFWDLTVSDDRFEVGLSFGGVPERVVVPLTAIKSFVDPSVPFGVQFEQMGESETAPDQSGERETGAASGKAATGPARPAAEHRHVVPELPTPVAANPPDDTSPPTGGGEVVRLDRFRKK